MIKMLVIAAAMVLAACATTGGHPISQQQIEAIKQGQTTRDDLLSVFGKPLVRSKNSDGTEVLAWGYAKVGFAGSSYENQSLSVIFGPDGKVVSYTTSQIANPY
ncbi:MAG TPA: hypothetical protein VGC62_23215 [Pseudomonas sp.]|uniref:hypothetical protein n=1 Tax=Pseudomonas sp. TaxID=306 RepID=UPI002EDA0FEC